MSTNNGLADNAGDGCNWYERDPCNDFDSDEFKANEMCCFCGGGNGTLITHIEEKPSEAHICDD